MLCQNKWNSKRTSVIVLMMALFALGAPVGSFAANSAVAVGPNVCPQQGSINGFCFVDSASNTNVTTINVGDIVTWTWVSGGHSVTSALQPNDPNYFDAGGVNVQGTVYKYQFMTPGTYFYTCVPHEGSPYNMVGTVIVMAAAFSSTAVNFGNLQVGVPVQKTLTFTNLYTNSLDMSSLSITGDFTQTNNCPNPLPGNASCTITITFTPSAKGSRTGTLTHSSAITAQLTGQGSDISIMPTRPTRLHPPPGGTASLNNISIPISMLVALTGFLLLARSRFLFS